MHHFKAKGGTHFNFNSDMSGDEFCGDACAVVRARARKRMTGGGR